jgi:hypothetical protein
MDPSGSVIVIDWWDSPAAAATSVRQNIDQE